MSEKPIICPFCNTEMIIEREAKKVIKASYICGNCGAYSHIITTRPLRLSLITVNDMKLKNVRLKIGDEEMGEVESMVIKLTPRPIYYNLALKKPAFDVLLAELRKYLSSEVYEYNVTLESIFFDLQAQQQEEDQLQKLVDDDPESITFKEKD